MKTLFLLTLLLLPRLALGAVGYDTVSSSSGNNVTTLTWNHTVTGSNTLLLCGSSVNDGSAPTHTATFNSVSMTPLGESNNGSNAHVFLFALVAPASGTHAVVIDNSQGMDLVAGCISLNGVDQGSLPAGVQTDFQIGPLSATITIPTNGMGVSFGYNMDVSACGSQTSGQTKRYDLCDSGPAINGFSSTTTATGSVAMTWTPSGVNYAGLIAVPVSPSISGGGGPAVARHRPIIIR